jgi:hypothetical protein
VFVGALLGIFLRFILPERYFSEESKDVVRLGTGLVATMAALVLGLLVASAKSSFDVQKGGMDQLSANLILLDNTLSQYGPEAQESRETLRRIVSDALKRIWPKEESDVSTFAPATMASGRTLLHVDTRTHASNRQTARSQVHSPPGRRRSGPDALAARRAGEK